MYLDTSFFHASVVLEFKIDPDLAMNWACELLEQGFDTYHLRILAGLQPDKMKREDTWDIVRKILDELRMPPLSKERAGKIYLTTLLKGYFEHKFTENEVLGRLQALCVGNAYCDLFYPFYFLTYDEMRHEAHSESEIFEEIEKRMRFEAKKLLNFLEEEDEVIVLQKLKDINFS